MENANNKATQDNDTAQKSGKLSHPYFDLAKSIEVAKVIHDQGGGTCSLEQLAPLLGYGTIQSGTFRVRVSAAKQFGLVRSNTAASNLSITERANQILSPIMPEDSGNAKADAFLSVELFKMVYEKFNGMSLPAEAGMANLFLQHNMPKDRVAPAIRVLMDSAEQAGFFAIGGRGRLVRPMSKQTQKQALPAHTEEKPSEEKKPITPAVQTPTVTETPNTVHTAIIGLLRELPPAGALWPTKQKTRFVKAFQATLDFIYPSDDETDGMEK